MEGPTILVLGEHVFDVLPVVLGDMGLNFLLSQPSEIGD